MAFGSFTSYEILSLIVSEQTIAAILLAAGNSSRMGTSKQLLPIRNITLLEHAVQCGLDSGVQHVIVVIGANSDQHRAAIAHLPVTIVEHADWMKGMGSSLKVGVNSVLDLWLETQALLIMVCDQPKLTTHHLKRMIEVYRHDKPLAVASEYNGISGVPALFDKRTFSDLLDVKDDRGARDVLQKIGSQVVRVPFADGVIDLDTKDDYERFVSGA